MTNQQCIFTSIGFSAVAFIFSMIIILRNDDPVAAQKENNTKTFVLNIARDSNESTSFGAMFSNNDGAVIEHFPLNENALYLLHEKGSFWYNRVDFFDINSNFVSLSITDISDTELLMLKSILKKTK